MKFSSFARMLGLCVCMAAVGCATAPPVPTQLQVPPGQELLIQPHATGMQIYQCEAEVTLGHGAFSNVKYTQRLNTVLGSAPAVGCRGEQSGQQLRAAYSADYFFYGVRR